ncbi:MAG: OmpA family protein [Bacteroidales bacterium]
MKRIVFWLITGLVLFSIAGCVTKQKYNELESRYKTCNDELIFATAEKIDFENINKQLDLELGQLKEKIEKMRNDTLSLSRKLRQSERDLAKSIRDYDDLLKNFAELNLNNNAEVNNLLSDIDKIKTQLEEREKELNKQRDELNLAMMNLSDQEEKMKELQHILDQKDAEVKSLKEKVSDALKGFAGSGLNVYEKNGKVYVSMEEKLLFASGSWEIGEQGLLAIKELAKVLENDQDINVLIEGHTDNVPYKGGTQVKDNWDLSVLRATAVVKALLKYGKIEPLRLSASGRGEYMPIDSNDNIQARAKNRRTEIILTPKLDALFNIIESN